MRIDPEALISPVSKVQSQNSRKLVDAAQQFEATMLQELLKPMQHGQSSWGDEEKSEDSASDTMSSFGVESIAKTLSKSGGFGIARNVVKQITREHQMHSERKHAGTEVCGSDADRVK